MTGAGTVVRPLVETHPISVGQMDWKTPLGVTRIVRKEKDPTWYPPKSVREKHLKDGDVLPDSIPPGPDNPLGDYALRLGIPGGAYLIHGTNKPVGVGMQITHGCIRLYPEDIEFLFGEVKVGMNVRIVNQRIKTGWLGAKHRVAVDWDRAERVFEEATGTPARISKSPIS